MIGAIAARVGEAWAVAAALQLALWAIQQRSKNAGTVDVGWALSFSLFAALFAARATAPIMAWAPLAVIATAWSLRLGGYLIARGAARSPEEGRYADLRRRWAPNAAGRFFVFFQAQAALAGLLSTALVVPFVAAPWDSGWLRAIGAAVSIIGIAGEATADAQLARWKRARKAERQGDRNGGGRGDGGGNPPRVCDVGLWRYSRHPNYFFEWCVWIGFAVYGFAFAPWGLIAIVPQAIILGSIFGITGIPPTEKQAIASKGDAYRDYQQRVSKFIPLPPKRS